MTSVTKMRNIKINLYRQIPLIILLFMVLILSISNKEFLTLQTFTNLMQQVSAVGVVALGAMFVIISGGIDFTTGYGLAMIGMAAATLYTRFINTNSIFSIFILVLVTLVVGAALGLVNGLVITKLRITPFIATLGVMSLAKGLSLLIGGGALIIFKDEKVLFIGQGKLFGFLPVSFLIFLLVSLIIYLILKKTKLGIYTYAIGGNEETVRFVGINVVSYKIFIYILAGICTGVATLLTITRIGIVSPSIYGTILLDAIAASIIGGTSLSGGKGSVSGTIVGVFIIVIVSTALAYLRIPPEMQEFFKGMVIFIAVGIDAYTNKNGSNI